MSPSPQQPHPGSYGGESSIPAAHGGPSIPGLVGGAAFPRSASPPIHMSVAGPSSRTAVSSADDTLAFAQADSHLSPSSPTEPAGSSPTERHGPILADSAGVESRAKFKLREPPVGDAALEPVEKTNLLASALHVMPFAFTVYARHGTRESVLWKPPPGNNPRDYSADGYSFSFLDANSRIHQVDMLAVQLAVAVHQSADVIRVVFHTADAVQVGEVLARKFNIEVGLQASADDDVEVIIPVKDFAGPSISEIAEHLVAVAKSVVDVDDDESNIEGMFSTYDQNVKLSTMCGHFFALLGELCFANDQQAVAIPLLNTVLSVMDDGPDDSADLSMKQLDSWYVRVEDWLCEKLKNSNDAEADVMREELCRAIGASALALGKVHNAEVYQIPAYHGVYFVEVNESGHRVSPPRPASYILAVTSGPGRSRFRGDNRLEMIVLGDEGVGNLLFQLGMRRRECVNIVRVYFRPSASAADVNADHFTLLLLQYMYGFVWLKHTAHPDSEHKLPEVFISPSCGFVADIITKAEKCAEIAVKDFEDAYALNSECKHEVPPSVYNATKEMVERVASGDKSTSVAAAWVSDLSGEATLFVKNGCTHAEQFALADSRNATATFSTSLICCAKCCAAVVASPVKPKNIYFVSDDLNYPYYLFFSLAFLGENRPRAFSIPAHLRHASNGDPAHAGLRSLRYIGVSAKLWLGYLPRICNLLGTPAPDS